MRKNIIYIFLVFFLGSCSRNQVDNDYFLIEIRNSQNLSCYLPEVTFLTRQQEAYQILGANSSIFIASNLPKVNYAIGTKLNVKIHKPDINETAICNTLGTVPPQVVIDQVK